MKRFKYYMEMIQTTEDPEIEKLINELELKSLENHKAQSPMSMGSLLKICKDYLKNKDLFEGFRKKLEERLKAHSNTNFKEFGSWLEKNPKELLK